MARNKDSSQKKVYTKEVENAVRKILEYKTICEANIVSLFYKSSDLLYDYDLQLKDFANNVWKVYWQIANDIVVKEQKPSLDEITIGLYLEKHPKLKEKYDEYGAYETVTKAVDYVEIENMNGYVAELHKWNAVLRLIKDGFPITDNLSELTDMSLDDIYSEYDARLNHIFINAEQDVDTFSISYKIDDLIKKLDSGIAVGLPYHDMPLLTKEISGDLMGGVTLVGALSGVGKSTFIRNTKIPSVLANNEKLVVMINEEDLAKWQREMLVWVANNIYKEDLQKYTVRDGNYTSDIKKLLYKCASWIKEKDESKTIIVIPFKRYRTSQAIKIIKKYSGLGVKYFVLDTFKADAGGKALDKVHMQMQQAMVDISDIVKPSNKNVHISVTFQLNKTSSRQRFFTLENIGMAKNIADVASVTLMIRNMFDDEKPNGKNPLKVYRLDGKNNKSKIPVTLDENKKYQIVFIVKNREGSSGDFQIVVEHDLSRNTIKEIGITHVLQDF